MTVTQVAESLNMGARRALRQLDANRGTLSPTRARELMIRGEHAEALISRGLATVSEATGDLELTPEGLEVLDELNRSAAPRRP